MPTYEYQCGTCGHIFEGRQAITDPPLTECPECRGPVNRLISGGAGFILKGARSENSSRRDGACSLESTGRTCCGRDTRCETPGCGSGA